MEGGPEDHSAISQSITDSAPLTPSPQHACPLELRLSWCCRICLVVIVDQGALVALLAPHRCSSRTHSLRSAFPPASPSSSPIRSWVKISLVMNIENI